MKHFDHWLFSYFFNQELPHPNLTTSWLSVIWMTLEGHDGIAHTPRIAGPAVTWPPLLLDPMQAQLHLEQVVPTTLKPPSLPPQFSPLVLLKTCWPLPQLVLSVEVLPQSGVLEYWHPILPQDYFHSPQGKVAWAAPLAPTDPSHLPPFSPQDHDLLILTR